jgi:hypothetical protein
MIKYLRLVSGLAGLFLLNPPEDASTEVRIKIGDALGHGRTHYNYY